MKSKFEKSEGRKVPTFLHFNNSRVLAIFCPISLTISDVFNSYAVVNDDRRWRMLRKFFPWIIDTCKFIHTTIRGVKTFATSFKYKNVSELLSLLGSDNFWVKKHFAAEKFGSGLGYTAKVFESWKGRATACLKTVFEAAKQFLNDKVTLEQQARLKILMGLDTGSLSAEEQANELTLEKMRRLGMDVEETSTLLRNMTDNPQTFAREAHEQMKKDDTMALVFYERFCKGCVGLHTAEIITGQSRLQFLFQGFDFVEMLPAPGPMAKVKADCEERRKGQQRRRAHSTSTKAKEEL